MASGFLVLVSFFTRIPLGRKIEYSEKDFARSLNLFSLVGAVIGLVLALASFIGDKFFSGNVRSLIIVGTYIAVTGGIHLDGSSDTADGLFSGRTGDKIFEIMSDSRIGAFGVICLIFLILSQFVLFAGMNIYGCFLMPVAGRACVITASYKKKYAKRTKGMGTLFIESTDGKVLLSNLIILFILCLTVPDRIVMSLSSLSSLIFSYAVSKWIEKKIGGMTGDTCGFMAEFSQIWFMLSIIFFEGIMK
jgi:adenosylcobinamide-GDP ribazoletransferase